MQFFPDSFVLKIYDKFAETAIGLVAPEHRGHVYFSDRSYFQAFEEADCDAVFMKQRRGLEKGISEGKLAGAMYFRLTRHRIIHLSKDIYDLSQYENLQEKVAIKVVCDLLRIDLQSGWIRQLAGSPRPGGMRTNFQNLYQELIYITSKRHYNQESLALFFDSCAYLARAIELLNTPVLALSNPTRT